MSPSEPVTSRTALAPTSARLRPPSSAVNTQGVRLPHSAQHEQPWLVHDIARDFTLDEVWEFPISADASKGETFRSFCDLEDAARAEPLSGPAEWLIQFRMLLGKLGLDRKTNQLPIPGCTETSVWERLKPEDRQPMPAPDSRFPFRIVYDRESERLLEFSNGSLHGLLHLSWAHKTGTLFAPRMAVYVKTRNAFGKMYMALIYPFRVLVVYPAILRTARRRWEQHRLKQSRLKQSRAEADLKPSQAEAELS